jgi:sulfate/thiosulfate-binding protein
VESFVSALFKFLTGSAVASACLLALLQPLAPRPADGLLHVSFDATREVLLEMAESFSASCTRNGIAAPRMVHSHGSSGSQARAVVAGLPADIVSLAVWPDLKTVVTQGLPGLVEADWLKKPSPWFTTMVFVVRRGNPKGIHSWQDLDRSDVQVMLPNPKVSGNGKLAFLALMGAGKLAGLSESELEGYLRRVLGRVPVLESSSRAATLSFATKGLGDVQITYESEAELVLREGLDLEKVIPEVSIMAPLPMAPVVRASQTAEHREFVGKYMDYFVSEEAQEIVVKHGFRPVNPAVIARHAERFARPKRFFTVEDVAGSWDDASKKIFGQDGLFDRVMAP